jgi:hypothetical protein
MTTRSARARAVVLALFLSLVAALATLTAPSATAASVGYCGISWGSLDKAAGTLVTSTIAGVRSGSHACYDRVVIDINGPAAGYRVGYVAQVLGPASGLPYALRGGARLQVVVLAPAYDDHGMWTLTNPNPRDLVSVNGYRTLRQVALVGSFEGQTTIGVGVRARLPFRVFTLAGPGSMTRIVIDIAHLW